MKAVKPKETEEFMDWNKMTDAQFDEARKAEPWAALEYTHSAERVRKIEEGKGKA